MPASSLSPQLVIDKSTADSFFSLHADGRRTAIVAFPLAAIIVGVLMWLSAGVLTFHDDAAQYISTASHIMAGHGALTSVLYYDNQLAQAAPAFQTVWPAGFPAITALVASLTGLEVYRALLLVSIFAHIGTAVALVMLVRFAGLNAWLGLAAGGFWLMNVSSWLSVARGVSDPLFQVFAIGVAVAIGAYFHDKKRSGQWLVLTILCGAGALMVRYQAVALLVPIVMAMSVGRVPLQSLRSRLTTGLLAVVPVCLLLAVLFVRNLHLTGTLTGGATSGRGQTLSEVASRLTWVPESLQMLVVVGLMISCLLSGIVALVLWVRDSQRLRTHATVFTPAARAVMVYCLTAYAANIALLIVLSLTSTAYVIEIRYLGVCLLFLVFPGVWLAANAGQFMPAIGESRFWPTSHQGVAGVIAVVTFAQLVVLQRPYLDRLAQAQPTQLTQILATNSVDSGSALTWLREHSASERPVLMSTHAHSLSLLADDSTVIGVPVPVFTSKSWDEAQIHALAKRHDVKYLVAFRGMETWVYRDLINKMLDANSCPDWMTPLVASKDLVIARIEANLPRTGLKKGAKDCQLPIPAWRSTIRTTAITGGRAS